MLKFRHNLKNWIIFNNAIRIYSLSTFSFSSMSYCPLASSTVIPPELVRFTNPISYLDFKEKFGPMRCKQIGNGDCSCGLDEPSPTPNVSLFPKPITPPDSLCVVNIENFDPSRISFEKKISNERGALSVYFIRYKYDNGKEGRLSVRCGGDKIIGKS